MKPKNLHTWILVGLSLISTAVTLTANADATATSATIGKTCTGMLTSSDPKEQRFSVRWLFLNKKFVLGDNCAVAIPGLGASTLNDLQPGQKVRISYQNAGGVLIANRIEQVPMRYEGSVKEISPAAHKLTLHLRGFDKMFTIASDCKILLRDNQTGTLADVKPGHHVAVVYEIPSGIATARQIEQTSAAFAGALTAIDTSDRTIKVKNLSSETRFHLADGCVILSTGKPDVRLSELKVGDKLAVNFDEINGVKVASRIAQDETTPQPTPPKSTK